MNQKEREELGKIVREGMLRAGIGHPGQSWDMIGEHKREPHRIAADYIFPAYEKWKLEKERNEG